MKLVSVMGMVYRLTEREYEAMLKECIAKGEFKLPDHRCLGHCTNVGDIDDRDARDMLAELKSERRRTGRPS